MASKDEEEYLMLSGIQHFAFCKRQWALIHVEQYWAENVLTFEGRQLHEKADDPYIGEKRGDRIISRAVPLVSHRLGVYGVADVIEFHRCEEGESGVSLPSRKGRWRPYPIEYKRGKPKSDNYDELQVCLQAICLEEMFEVEIPEGALFYGEIERRTRVELTLELRAYVATMLGEMHELLRRGTTPSEPYNARCDRCSLYEGCHPKLRGKRSIGYLQRHLQAVLGEDSGYA
jgi:CRISPR-associated exonuclease Cas4